MGRAVLYLAACTFVLGFSLAKRSERCDKLPRGYRAVCRKMQRHHFHLREQLEVGHVDFSADSPNNTLDANNETVADCRTIKCLARLAKKRGPTCNKSDEDGTTTQASVPLGKAVRKEYRMLTKDERERYHAALRQMKQNGTYDRFAHYHVKIYAHSGPAFLPWHREYLKRYETELRLIDPSVALPYWDSSLDNNLADPRDSTIFTADFMGASNDNGTVINGPFSTWRGLHGNTITRKFGAYADASLYNTPQIDILLGFDKITDILAYNILNASCNVRYDYLSPESQHNTVHDFIGGEMGELDTASFDPIFFMHHAFVDYLWEEWRQKKQNETERESEFPPHDRCCVLSPHFSTNAMTPFNGLTNLDGLSNCYTQEFYEYAPRPTCTNENPDCGSAYLFCDTMGCSAQCAVRMQDGSDCSRYAKDINPCLGGCLGNICVSRFVFWCSTTVCEHANKSQRESCLEMCEMESLNCNNVAVHSCLICHQPFVSVEQCMKRRGEQCRNEVSDL